MQQNGPAPPAFQAALSVMRGYAIIGDTKIEAREVEGGRPFHVLSRVRSALSDDR